MRIKCLAQGQHPANAGIGTHDLLDKNLAICPTQLGCITQSGRIGQLDDIAKERKNKSLFSLT